MTNDANDPLLSAWEAKQPAALTGDSLWRLNCYREAMFLMELSHADLKVLDPHPDRAATKDQLYSAVCSVAANIAEGYGRPTTGDRVRFFSYALGSLREATTWYLSFRPTTDVTLINDRIERLSRIRRMLLGLISRLRTKGGRKFDSW
ncbi:MAG TPA: four helix bundle protein [Gemmatimonadaceae bacterium]|jgi:four helix bundle protein|nr:four helix bundle protein [Gemmatimonadaceae bacterium]